MTLEEFEKRLLQRGAEADLYLEKWHGLEVIRKVRVRKLYRVGVLDVALRRARTAHEALIMHDAKKAGVETPLVYLVDVENAVIVMQYIVGMRLKEYLENSSVGERQRVCRLLGDRVGRLHFHGIVHGDLTTSNVVLTGGSGIVLIDFGLAEYSRELEKRGIDILLGKRVFHSTHHGYGSECYRSFLDGYRDRVGFKEAERVEDRVGQIERRGRYAVER